MDVVYARGTFFIDGVGLVSAGTVWPADDPAVKANPDGFTADPAEAPGFCRTTADPPGAVEQATAAPGERRTVRRAR